MFEDPNIAIRVTAVGCKVGPIDPGKDEEEKE